MKGVRQLLISSIPARLAYGMISLGIFFKVENTTSSIAIAADRLPTQTEDEDAINTALDKTH